MKISACVLQRFAGIVTATLVAPLLLSGCGNSNVSEDSSSLEEMTYLQEEAVKTNSVFTSGEFTLYYTNASHTAIYETVKDYDFQGWSTEAIVEQVLADLVNVDWVETEDKNVEAVSIVPFKHVEVEGIREETSSLKQSNADGGFPVMEDLLDSEVTTTKHILQMKMSADYSELTPNKNVVFRTGLGKALLSLGIFDTIELYVESEAADDGSESSSLVDTINPYDAVILNQYNKDFYTDKTTVNLYFISEDRESLTKEKRTLTLTLTDKLPEVMVRELIKGPEEEGLSSAIPVGTEINEIMIKDKVCYLDLSAEFQKNHLGGPREEALTIYSIVNSLTELPNIQYVQFLIDGQRVETYKTEVKLGYFLSPNVLYVKVEENE